MGKRNIAAIILIIFIVATLILIWSNSIENVKKSQRKSLNVLKAIKPMLEIFIDKEKVTDHLVRKMAHFIEFSSLGAELALFLIISRRVRWQGIVNCASFGLAAALIDETIQRFSSRGSQVKDIWLDFTGVCFGIMYVFIVYWVINAIRAWYKFNRGEMN
ncbi:MAG: VanZ family protein [Eubacteriales bacterium]|jgi:VanZ family protein|nr:VanZ family protein [Clostridiales bacterium]